MKLIEILDLRIVNNGKRRYRFGLFLCPYCLQEVERLIENGLKTKSCGCAKSELISNFRKNYVWSEVSKLKISINKKGKPSGMLGKKQVKETRKKQSQAMKGKFSGNKHWNWQNGKSSEEYSEKFNRYLKNKIKNRDLNICQTPNCMGIENLHIHHIDYDKKNNIPENLITLCRKCHIKTIGKNNRNYWGKYYLEIINSYL